MTAGARGEFDVALFPRGSAGKRAGYSTGTGWCLSRDSRQEAAAWELMKHLASRDAQELMVALPLRNVPGRASAAALWTESVKALGFPEHAGVYATAAAEAYTLEPVAWWLEFADACDNALPQVWEGQLNLAEALVEIEQRTNAGAQRYG